MRKIPKMFCVTVTLSCFVIGLHFYVQEQKHPAGTSFEEVLKAQLHRKSILKSVCLKNNLTRLSEGIDPLVAPQLFVEEKHQLLYCEVPKVGCSNWKRIIFLLKQKIYVKPDFLHHFAIHDRRLLKRLTDYPQDQQKKMLDTYTKVMFTRDPLQRLVSAYRDKFFHAVGYHGIQLPQIIKARYRKNKNSTDNVHFNEFIQYVVNEMPPKMDIHWRPMHYLCDPCNIKYDVLGKLETVKKDSDYVLHLIGAPPSFKYPDIKQYNESKTDSKITSDYFSEISLGILDRLLDIYELDFSLFDYF